MGRARNKEFCKVIIYLRNQLRRFRMGVESLTMRAKGITYPLLGVCDDKHPRIPLAGERIFAGGHSGGNRRLP